MDIIDLGHHYKLSTLDGNAEVYLTFVRRFRGEDNYAGTTCQEVLRVLIDRTKFLDGEIPWSGNADIILHMEQALAGFEARAILRKAEKGQIEPSSIIGGKKDGHWRIKLKGEELQEPVEGE